MLFGKEKYLAFILTICHVDILSHINLPVVLPHLPQITELKKQLNILIKVKPCENGYKNLYSVKVLSLIYQLLA